MEKQKEAKNKNEAAKQFLESVGYHVRLVKSFNHAGEANEFLHVSFGEFPKETDEPVRPKS